MCRFLHSRRLRIEALEDRRLLSTFTVANTLDSGTGSLRQAIIDANASLDGGTIKFEIPGTDPNFIDVDSTLTGGDIDADAWRIRPLTELPALSNVAAGVTIDGRSQTAIGGDPNPFGPEIILDGNGLFARGLHITTSDHAVFGLNIQRFARSGIFIEAGDRNFIAGNYVGVNATGTAAAANERWGVSMDSGATDNVIGTNADGLDDLQERNVISGNLYGGVGILDQGTDRNIIAGNYIGTNASATAAIGNANRGVDINSGAQSNRIGTNADGQNDAAEANVISGNVWSGVSINGVGSSFNVIAGNFLGTNASGDVALGNKQQGVVLFGAATSNRVGGAVPAARNIISGNEFSGIRITGAGTSNNVIAGNYIGTNVAGTAAIPNLAEGIILDAAPSGNWIGTNGDGIGDATEGNLISGNGATGVRIASAGTTLNVVAGNFIGVNSAGDAALANGNNGIGIGLAAAANRIGTDRNGISDNLERNVISGNTGIGIAIADPNTSLNVLAGNLIGTGVNGLLDVANGSDGVRIWNSASGNLIGGPSGLGNTIAFNKRHGVALLSTALAGNAILGNSIYANSGLGIDLGVDGVTPNDAGDGDSGPNNYQNSPVISGAIVAGIAVRVAYSVPSNSENATYPLRVEFFKADASGLEGQIYLGSDTFSAADLAAGAKVATFGSAAAIAPGDKIVATATDSLPGGGTASTSEFSSSRDTIANPWHNAGDPGNVDDDPEVAAGDALYVINYLNAFGPTPVPVLDAPGPLYYDTDGDLEVSPGDALLVINLVNAQPRLRAPEPPGAHQTATDHLFRDLDSQTTWLLSLAAGSPTNSKPRRAPAV